MYKKIINRIKNFKINPWREFKLWQKITSILVGFILLSVATMYGIARWYIATQANTPLTLGTSFVPDYARYLGVDPKQTLGALIDDMKVRDFRLTSFWSEGEPTQGHYDFSELDWEFNMINKVNGKVSLSIGLRQPRWPECHVPEWAKNEPKSVWYPQLLNYMSAVIDRYKNNPALYNYELENEYFLKVFGTCTDFSRSRLIDEFNFVKEKDPYHEVVISRSNNAIGLPIDKPTPDLFGVSVYKRVYDKTITHRYYEYPFPAWFYGFLAGGGEIIKGKNMIIHELQAEPWPPGALSTTSVEEQNKSMDAKRLASRFEYGEATGIRTIYMWGAEWWYSRMVNNHDPSVWNVAKSEFQQNYEENLKIEKKNMQQSSSNQKTIQLFANLSNNKL